MFINLIIIGAKADGTRELINNPLQADHSDLCNLKSLYDANIFCYDLGYCQNEVKDGIYYIADKYNLGDTSVFLLDAINIIIEFCNFLDENYINHGDYGQYQHENMLNYTPYKVALLSCGCGWQYGFPINCIKNIIEHQLLTYFNAYNVDCFLSTISNVQYITNLEFENVSDSQPFLLGMYQVMGTLKWRGCEADNYKSEIVLRDLFTIIIDNVNINDDDKNDLLAFVENKKHWNNMKWSARIVLSKFIYSI
jgi:hypothetical protein